MKINYTYSLLARNNPAVMNYSKIQKEDILKLIKCANGKNTIDMLKYNLFLVLVLYTAFCVLANQVFEPVSHEILNLKKPLPWISAVLAAIISGREYAEHKVKKELELANKYQIAKNKNGQFALMNQNIK